MLVKKRFLISYCHIPDNVGDGLKNDFQRNAHEEKESIERVD
jgi:hypothetical protein